MVKIATQCINFFVCINLEKFAISVWRFAPHCVVKFTTVYSTNYKTVWKSIVWELLPYVVYYHTHSKNIDKCGKNPQSGRRKSNYHTRCGKNCHKILYMYDTRFNLIDTLRMQKISSEKLETWYLRCLV